MWVKSKINSEKSYTAHLACKLHRKKWDRKDVRGFYTTPGPLTSNNWCAILDYALKELMCGIDLLRCVGIVRRRKHVVMGEVIIEHFYKNFRWRKEGSTEAS